MFRSGAFVADHVTPVSPDQVQPNGVDLTLEAVEEQVEPGRIEAGNKRIGDRQSVSPRNDPPQFALEPGYYVAQYAERIEIPADHIGFVYPRSSLMRNSCMLNTAVWDAGYTGRGEGLLQVGHPITIDVGARFAQLVLAKAAHETEYDGSYQAERL